MGSLGGIRQYWFICIFVYLNHLKSICVFVYLFICVFCHLKSICEIGEVWKGQGRAISALSSLPPSSPGKDKGLIWNVECLLIMIPSWVGLGGERS